MTRGDSFFVPSLSILKDVVVIYERAKQANKVVQCIDVLENGMLGIRVYCIK